MKKQISIVTHAGRAHRDEFLACCLIVFHEYTKGGVSTIERRRPTEEDTANRFTWVVDTGGLYAPDSRNFDHHQDDPAVAGMCSFDMVFRHILGDEAWKIYGENNGWLAATTLHDTHGPSAVSEKLGLSAKDYVSLRSPIEKAILTSFGSKHMIHPGSLDSYMMLEMGRTIFVESNILCADVSEVLDATPEPFSVGRLRVWDIRRACGEDNNVSTAAINKAASHRGVDISVSIGKEGVVTLYRYAWANEKIDMARIRGEADVLFSHSNGFFATLGANISNTRIAELIRLAMLPEH